jgi:catechol 2,3-dioxygenase-like lactoylglutathione lyase family enzyme
MLGNTDAIATIAVKDIKVAGRFYTETLGLKRTGPEQPGTATFTTGKTSLFVYESKFARTNQATSVSWDLGGDLENVVRTLKERGVTFEHYDDLADVQRKGDLHFGDGLKLAWFKDPDGNIHALMGR